MGVIACMGRWCGVVWVGVIVCMGRGVRGSVIV